MYIFVLNSAFEGTWATIKCDLYAQGYEPHDKDSPVGNMKEACENLAMPLFIIIFMNSHTLSTLHFFIAIYSYS